MARVRNAYGVVMLVLVTAYFAAAVARPVLVGLIGLIAVLAVEYGVARERPQRAGAWHLVAVALALLSAGDVVFIAMENASPDPVPFPALPDAIYLATYIPLTVGLFWLGRPTSPYSDQTTLIDSISLTLAGSLIVWITLVRNAVTGELLSTAGRVVAVAAWVGYIAVFSASMRVLLSWRRNISVMLLGAAILSFLISELFYGKKLIHGTWTSGSLVDFGYFVFIALSGASALHSSMRDVASPVHARHNLGPGRLTLIALALLIAPTALLVEASRKDVSTGVAIALVSGLVSILMLVRLTMTGRAFQRRAAREHAARVASQTMVTALTPEQVVAGTRAALRRVTSERGPVQVELVRPYAGPPHPSPEVRATETGGELVAPLSGTDAAMVFLAPPSELQELRELLAALADQAALAVARIDLMETTRAEERERYFRTLVLTSTDVILICRGGRVEYATPSGKALFGRSVVGERFDDLLRPAPDSMPGGQQMPVDASGRAHWPDATLVGVEAFVVRPDGRAFTVLVHRRDLTGDPSVHGVVTTLRDVTEERALKRDLAYRASHDEMTGLSNARAWGEEVSAERERRRRAGEGVGVLFIDLDNFKQINDRYGHPVGDRVLAEVGRRIRLSVRAGDLAARVGGDEFAALLRNMSTVEDARTVARRLAEALARPVSVDATEVECQASIGLAYTEGTEPLSTLVQQADTALYAAKEQGKGRWTEYNAKQWRPARATRNGSGDGASSARAGERTIR